jgi:hypothetical protein
MRQLYKTFGSRLLAIGLEHSANGYSSSRRFAVEQKEGRPKGGQGFP